MNQPKYAGHFCPAPWEYAVIQEKGDVHLCSCSAWAPAAVGSLEQQSWDEIWNGKQAQAMRASILDGSFKYCDGETCPYLNGATGRVRRMDAVTDPEHLRIIEEGRTTAGPGPKFAQICYDPTCNLTCPSCRCERIVARGEELGAIERIHAQVEESVLPGLQRLDMSGQGEVFASRVYLPILRHFDREKYPQLKIWLTTNGMLLNPKMWESIRQSHEAIHAIHVSMNAASEATFHCNQEGGNWAQFVENMDFVGTLRRKGIIQEFTLGYYVQVNNYQEMPKVVGLLDRFGADKVYFANMTNWGTYSDKQFAAQAVHLPEHPEHEAFLEVLRDPQLRDPRIHLGNLMRFLPEAELLVDGAAPLLPLDHLLDLCVALSLDDDATQKACVLVDRTKRLFVQLLHQTPQDSGESPLAFLVRSRALEASQAQSNEDMACARQFSHLLRTSCPAGHEKTYAELAGELSCRCQQWFEAGLPEDALKQLRNAGTIDWISMASTSDPLGEAVVKLQNGAALPQQQEHPAEITARHRVKQLQANWKIDAETAHTVLATVNKLKENVAKLCMVPSDTDGAAPIDHFAEALAASRPDAQRVFRQRLRHTRPSGADECYAIILRRMEIKAAAMMRKALPDDAWEQVRDRLPRQLVQMDTDYDPISQVLARKVRQKKSTPQPRPKALHPSD